MKRVIVILLCLAITAASCNKQIIGGDIPLPPVALKFALIDKNGKNLIHSVNDVVGIAYVANGFTQTLPLTVYKAQVSLTDTTRITTYGGFIISDKDMYGHSSIAGLSAMWGHNFNIYVNGVNTGSMYMDYSDYMALSSPRPLSSFFTFNSTQVSMGALTGVYSNGTQIVQTYPYPQADMVYLLAQ